MKFAQSFLGVLSVLVLGVVLGPPPALANARSDILDAAERCDSLHNDHEWLDCYYGAAQPMRAKLGLVPAPQTQQRLLPPPVANHGLFATILGQDKVADVVSGIRSYDFDGAGHFTVTLVNGQIWAQTSSDLTLAKWSRPAATMTATISPGAFGTFNLSVQSESRAYKVKRLQ